MKNKLIYLGIAIVGIVCFSTGYMTAQSQAQQAAVSNLILAQADQLSRDTMLLTLFKQNCPDRMKWMLELRVQSGVAHLDSFQSEIVAVGLPFEKFNDQSRLAQEALHLTDTTGTVADVSRECKQELNTSLQSTQ